MKTMIPFVIVAMLVSATPIAAQETTMWKDVAGAIPLGSRVKAETRSGKHYSGTLMRVSDDAILVKRNTRMPEPAVSIPYSEVAKIEREHGNGISVGKAIGIGLAAGAAVIGGLLLIALATFED